jgi:broad specificity phosphatase PhoE
MGEVWLVRHAPAALSGVCYGQSDVPVTVEPIDAARAIIQRWDELRAGDAPELWTSPWARTQPVAEELARFWRTSLRVDARLSELSFGLWEGRTYAEVERTDSVRFQRWMHAYEVEAPPGGETVAELRARVEAWLGERKATSSAVLAVTHAGVMRMARAVSAGLTYSKVAGEKVSYLCPQRIV